MKEVPDKQRVRLAIVSSHPVQYNAPAFQAIAADTGLDVHVFYGWKDAASNIDVEFGQVIEWDVPLLTGYEYTFVPNVSRQPGTNRFGGIDNPGMVDAIRDWNPDAILIYGWSFATHLRVMWSFHGKVPILFRGDSTLLDARSRLYEIARQTFLRWVYGRVDVALYSGRRNREYYRRMGLREDQLVWAPHAVDNARFADRSADHECEASVWRARLGIDPTAFVFLFAGKLTAIKDPHLLLDAFLSLSSRTESGNAHLVFVGDGEIRRGLEQQALGHRRIHFLGFQNQSAMPAVYRLGNVLVLPSRSETWGLAVNEAMASHRPVIVSDRVGSAVDLVEPGVTGHVFAHGNRESLADIMSKTLADPLKAATMGRSAAESIERWSIDSYAGIVSSTVKEVARAGRG